MMTVKLRHKKTLSLLIILGYLLSVLPARIVARPQTTPLSARVAKKGRPSLVVLITVDQLRGDLLDRYKQLFKGGFRRLLDGGLIFTRATVDHCPTNSYPGHVTIATGMHPAHHGIIDNSWAEQTGQKFVAVAGVEDPLEKIVDFPSLTGASPHRLMVTGLPDWFTNGTRARAVNISSGEYASLLQAGKSRTDTYWFSIEAGRYVTSTYYRNSYPEWVQRFNRERLPHYMSQRGWECTVPEKARRLSRRDDAPYEFDGVHTTFPHIFSNEVPEGHSDNPQAYSSWFYFTPMIDAATLDLASEAVRALSLGGKGATDYLSVVVSATDSIGHRYGPLSLEQLDNLLRLDLEMGQFFQLLDEAVGRGRYIVALTADHGAPEIPEYLSETGGKGRRVKAEEIDMLLREVKEATAGVNLTQAQSGATAARIAEKYDFIADIITNEELASPRPADEFLALYRNSYFPNRTPIYPLASGTFPSLARYGLRVRLKEGAVPYFAPSVHGSPYMYDRHVPIIFMGPGIPAGRSKVSARTVDIAPTLAGLAGVRTPPNLDGKRLQLNRLLKSRLN